MNDYKIKELYEEMEKELISSMKRNLKRHLNEEEKTGFKYTQWQAEKLKELSKYRKQNKAIIGEYTSGINKEVANHIKEEVKQGSINAIKQYNKILGDKLKPSKLMNKSFFKTNDRKVNALIKVVNNDLKTANTSALRMANDQYRQVIHKSAFFVGNGVFTEQQAARMATAELSELKMTELAIDEANKPFLAGGLNCIEYKNGRRVNIASYSQMAVRTANLRAQLMGEGDFRKSIGRTLVQATSHGGACPICQKWEKHIFIDDVYSGGTKEDGKYMLLSEAMAQGFLHPNCRHGLTTYYPELENIENESEEEYQNDLDYINERMNYIERNIKKYDRLELGSVALENETIYKTKDKKWKDLKQRLLETINDIKTNEKIPLKLYELPNNEEIKGIINNAPSTLKTIINSNKDAFKFKNIKSIKTARYSPVFDDIKLNLAIDKRQDYKTLFHEMSHKLDHLLGNLSQDKIFEKLLVDDFNRIKNNYMIKYNVSEEIAYKKISNILKTDSKMNSISDIIGGITNNKCVGTRGHFKKGYWDEKGKIGREAFAHFGSASIRKDTEELGYIKDVFPNAYNHFKSQLKGVVKK